MGMHGYITFAEAAEMTGRTQGAIRTAVARGYIPQYERLGRKVLKPREVASWASAVKVGRPKKE